MIFESCSEIRGHFSDYIDGVCLPEKIHSVRYHLAHCVPCSADLARYEALHSELRQLSRQQVSADLALRLRVQVSQELHRKFFQRFMVRLENMCRPVLLPSVAGVLVALICIGLMLGAGAPQASNIPDVPLDLVTPPRVQVLAPMNIDPGAEPLVLVTYVNAQGHVTSYRILSGQQTPGLMQRLDRMMYYSLFEPATSFGQPTSGRVVLSFRTITVRG
jgi:anti-sigma factor RsiW